MKISLSSCQCGSLSNVCNEQNDSSCLHQKLL